MKQVRYKYKSMLEGLLTGTLSYIEGVQHRLQSYQVGAQPLATLRGSPPM